MKYECGALPLTHHRHARAAPTSRAAPTVVRGDNIQLSTIVNCCIPSSSVHGFSPGPPRGTSSSRRTATTAVSSCAGRPQQPGRVAPRFAMRAARRGGRRDQQFVNPCSPTCVRSLTRQPSRRPHLRPRTVEPLRATHRCCSGHCPGTVGGRSSFAAQMTPSSVAGNEHVARGPRRWIQAAPCPAGRSDHGRRPPGAADIRSWGARASSQGRRSDASSGVPSPGLQVGTPHRSEDPEGLIGAGRGSVPSCSTRMPGRAGDQAAAGTHSTPPWRRRRSRACDAARPRGSCRTRRCIAARREARMRPTCRP